MSSASVKAMKPLEAMYVEGFQRVHNENRKKCGEYISLVELYETVIEQIQPGHPVLASTANSKPLRAPVQDLGEQICKDYLYDPNDTDAEAMLQRVHEETRALAEEIVATKLTPNR